VAERKGALVKCSADGQGSPRDVKCRRRIIASDHAVNKSMEVRTLC
jgi:hypothetical protein